jgi:hypothetical protein
MLIRPFSAKPAEAAFFVREEGAFPREAPRTFQFSRMETAVEAERPPERPLLSGTSEIRNGFGPRVSAPEQPVQVETLWPARLAEKPARRKFRWMWIPLSLAFVLVGAIAGYQASQTMASAARSSGAFSLALHVVPIGDNLAVRWDPETPAVRNAQSGRLEIENAGYSKAVDLDSAHLQSGSVLYRNTSASVRFRLIVYESARVSLTETVDWPR